MFHYRYWLHHHRVLLRNIPMAFDIWDEPFVVSVPLEADRIVPLRHIANGSSESPAVGDLLIYGAHEELISGMPL